MKPHLKRMRRLDGSMTWAAWRDRHSSSFMLPTVMRYTLRETWAAHWNYIRGNKR